MEKDVKKSRCSKPGSKIANEQSEEGNAVSIEITVASQQHALGFFNNMGACCDIGPFAEGPACTDACPFTALGKSRLEEAVPNDTAQGFAYTERTIIHA
jgi:hypothetical protein